MSIFIMLDHLRGAMQARVVADHRRMIIKVLWGREGETACMESI